MTAILFGSISTIADTSELQREAFNDAFREHGLDWEWSRDEYRPLLARSGGRDRVAEYADARGVDVDADAVHRTKTARFQERLQAGVPPRPGVAETIRAAHDRGIKVALVTTTAPASVAALLAGVDGLGAGDFDAVTDGTTVAAAKPDAAVYAAALEQLGEAAGGCVAIEDNVPGVEAARAAGLRCVAFPNANTVDHDFSAATTRTDTLDLDRLGAD